MNNAGFGHGVFKVPEYIKTNSKKESTTTKTEAPKQGTSLGRLDTDGSALLERCHEFVVHAMCSIPDDVDGYKRASELIKEMNEFLYPNIKP